MMDAKLLEQYITEQFEKHTQVTIYDSCGNVAFNLFKPEMNKKVTNINLGSIYDTKILNNKYKTIFDKSKFANFTKVTNFILEAVALLNITLDRLVYTTDRDKNTTLMWITNSVNYCTSELQYGTKEFKGVEIIQHIEDNPNYNCVEEKEFSGIVRLVGNNKVIINIFHEHKNIKQIITYKNYPSEAQITKHANTAIEYLIYRKNYPTSSKQLNLIFHCHNCTNGVMVPITVYTAKDSIYMDEHKLLTKVVNEILPEVEKILPKYHTCFDYRGPNENHEIGVYTFKCIHVKEEFSQLFPDKECDSFDVGSIKELTIDKQSNEIDGDDDED